ncbi:hypothetical protein [Roseomonas fluvialis]|uniref:Hedgehog/Intein (Hint) domain-containing protein n=1 Tax=Roseomonas fluvialis TaxID=1750527 RepID=A0ABM7Y696_9PROT|nr:hypothetical protein [Roseomonas fluvialis]BDG73448.1 hypothetical protein Rmf_33770 [Roseomonas fluvialis]
MPFSALGLSALTSANGFTLWHYRTEDLRATVLAPGYFAPAGAQLQPGDIVIVQAADATALVPIRGGSLVGGGVTVDGSGGAPTLLRSASLVADIDLAAIAAPRAIVLDTIGELLFEGETLAAGATIIGPLTQVTFTLLTSGGATAAAPQTVPVAGGRAGATFAVPPPGGGYRLRVAETADPTLLALSPPFAVTFPPKLLLETGGRLRLENDALLLL